MKRILIIFVLLVGSFGYGQALSQYQRLQKRTTTQVNAIDTTRTDIYYTAVDSTLGIEVINRMNGNGWVPRFSGGSFADLSGDPYDNTLLAEDLNGKQNTLTFDAVPTNSSTNPVQSNGIFDQFALKANDNDVLKLSGTQTANGNKNFNGSLVLNHAGTSTLILQNTDLVGINSFITLNRTSGYFYIQNNESNDDGGGDASLSRIDMYDSGATWVYGDVFFKGEAVGVTGTEMLTIDSSGNVDSQAIPSGTIADGSITNAKLADADPNSLLGNNTGSAATPVYLTTVQVGDMLGLGDLAVLDAVTSTEITDGTIVNADINASAGIASTKIALTPFGDIASTNVQDGMEELYTEQGTQISTNSGNISTNAADIAAIEASLATVPASSISYNNQTAPYTLVASDAQDNKIVRLAYDGEDLTLPSSVFDEGQAVKISYAQTGVGDANIVEGSGTSILGYTDGITLSAYPSGVTLSRISSATAPEVYEVVDYYGTIADYLGCVADANEKAITANGASDPNCNEANATTGFVATTNITLSTISTGQNVGLYAVKGTSTSSISYMTYRFAAVAGGTYTVTFDVNKTVGTDQRLTAWENCTGGPSSVNVTASVWAAKTYNITATATADVVLRFYAAGGSGSSGDDILVDNLSIVHTNP